MKLENPYYIPIITMVHAFFDVDAIFRILTNITFKSHLLINNCMFRNHFIQTLDVVPFRINTYYKIIITSIGNYTFLCKITLVCI